MRGVPLVQDFPWWTVMLTPLVIGALLVNLPYFGFPGLSANAELWYLRAYFVFAVVVYGRWAIYVINSICNYLGINCLTIPEGKLEQKGQQPREASRIGSGQFKKA